MRCLFLLSLLVILVACATPEERAAEHRGKGWAFVEANDLEKARVEFNNALQIDPRDLDAHYGAGQVAERQENIPLALGHYRAATDASEQELRSRVAMARILLLGGAMDQAEPLIEQALTLEPQDAEALTLRGVLALARGDAEKAESDARLALKADPANSSAVTFMAGLLGAKNKPQEAVFEIERALRAKPEDVGLRAVLAELLYRQGDSAGAIEALQEIVSREPNTHQHRRSLARLFIAQNDIAGAEKVLRDAVQQQPADVGMRASLAEFLLSAGRTEEALKTFTEVVDSGSPQFEMTLALGAMLERLKRFDEARKRYETLIAEADSDRIVLMAKNRLARVLAASDRRADAQQLIGEVLAANAADADALFLRASIALADQRPEEAIADLRSALRDRPNDLPMLRTLSLAYQATGDIALAKDTLQRVADLAPRDSSSRMVLASLALQSGQTQEAVTLTTEAQSILPKDAGVAAARMAALLAAKQWSELETEAKRMRTQHPEDPRGAYFEGLALQAQERVPQAEKAFVESLAIRPGGSEPLSQLVRLYLARQQTKPARDRLNETLEAVPGHPVAMNLLGEVYLIERNAEAAIKQFDGLIAAQPKWWIPYRGRALAAGLVDDRTGVKRVLDEGFRQTNEPALALDLALLRMQDGEFDQAITLYREILEVRPSDNTAANNLAMLLAQHKTDASHLDEALKLAERFQSSQDANFLDTLGFVHLRRGEHQAALPFLQRAVALRTDDAQLRTHLALAQHGAGDVQGARENLRKALAGSQEFGGSEEARVLLGNLGG